MNTMGIGTGPGRATFVFDGKKVWLRELGGFCFLGDGPRGTQGLAVVNTVAGRFEADAWECLSATPDGANSVVLRLKAADSGLELESRWTVDPVSGVVSRCDRLLNRSVAPIRVFRCLARLGLPSGNWDVYAQESRWCHESQGGWRPMPPGALQLGCAWGRTTQGGTPFAAIRPVGGGAGLAFHVAPVGNWVIRFQAHTLGDSLPLVSVELGLADDNLHFELAPGAVFELPEILLQSLPVGDVVAAAPDLQGFLLRRDYAKAKPFAPIVFNTWFDQFEILDVPRLRAQLAAAKALGCEVFTVDAGWYGAGSGNWFLQVGDWREKTDAAFAGRMREFADEVRAAGLGFGLWMEPERIGPEAPIRQAHPEWIVSCGECGRIDLENAAAYAWVRAEMLRLIHDYRLAWMKIDFNFELDADDGRGTELAGYTAAWCRLLKEVRRAAPDTFFEGCASGALRLDLESLQHVDGHFLSDSVNPIDMLRISQGTWLRSPPGRITRWAVLRDAGRVIPRYGKRVADSLPAVLVPGGAVWEPAEVADPEFVLLAAMPGMLGLGGDLAGLSPEVAAGIRTWLGFYKEWREFIVAAAVHLLTPPERLEQRTGWMAFQLQRPDADGASLVFVYRLGESGAAPRLCLCGLEPSRLYTVRREPATGSESTLSGTELMMAGLPVPFFSCTGYNRTAAAVVLRVRPEKG